MPFRAACSLLVAVLAGCLPVERSQSFVCQRNVIDVAGRPVLAQLEPETHRRSDRVSIIDVPCATRIRP